MESFKQTCSVINTYITFMIRKNYLSCKKANMVKQPIVPEQSSSWLTLVEWRQPGSSPHNSIRDIMYLNTLQTLSLALIIYFSQGTRCWNISSSLISIPWYSERECWRVISNTMRLFLLHSLKPRQNIKYCSDTSDIFLQIRTSFLILSYLLRCCTSLAKFLCSINDTWVNFIVPPCILIH